MNVTKFVYKYTNNETLYIFNMLTLKYVRLEPSEIKYWNNSNFDNLSMSSIDLLRRAEILSNSVEEALKRETTLIRRLESKSKNLSPNNLLYISEECANKCSYCFQSASSFSKDKMTKEIVDTIIKKLCIHKEHEHLRLSIFGGEPLEFGNEEIVDYALSGAVATHYDKKHIEIVTNGRRLEHFIPIIAKYRFDTYSIRLTLYGDEELNQTRYPEPFQAYKTINIAKNIPGITQINVNLLLDLISITKMEKLFFELEQEGLLDDPIVHFEFGRIQDRSDPEDKNNPSRLHYSDYYPELLKLRTRCLGIQDYMIGGSEMQSAYLITKAILEGRTIVPSIAGCSAVYPGRICFLPDGTIFPCTDLVRVQGLSRTVETWEGLSAVNQFSTHLNDVNCLSCPWLLVCNGGCMATNIFVNSNAKVRKCLDYGTSIDKMMPYLLDNTHHE